MENKYRFIYFLTIIFAFYIKILFANQQITITTTVSAVAAASSSSSAAAAAASSTTKNRSFLSEFLRYRSNANDKISLGCSSVLDTLQNSTGNDEWAFKILDSNAVPETGLADGNIQFLGYFDQCIEQKVPDSAYIGTEHNSGVQYCTINFPISMILNDNQSQIYPKFVLQMLSPQAGICLPAICNQKTDLPELFNTFAEKTNFSLQVTNCVTQNDLSFSNRFHLRHIIILVAYGIIILIGLADSLLPEVGFSAGVFRRIISCFGIIRNFKTLFEKQKSKAQSLSTIPFVRKPSVIVSRTEYSSNSLNSTSSRTSTESSIAPIEYSVRTNQELQQQQQYSKPKMHEIECLHGIRFISFFFILLYHTFTGAQIPSANLLSVVRAESSFLKQLITNAGLWVDTFFLLGGFLTCHTLISRSSPNEKVLDHFLKHPKRLLHRYIRLTPSIAGAISLSILIEALGSGPIWYEYTASSETTCHKNWYLPLIYLNNIVKLNQLGQPPRECLSYLWYLGVDIQFFFISPILVSCLANGSRRTQKFGILINLGTILASSIYTYWQITDNNLTPTVLMNVYDLAYINQVYKSPLCRIGPYCVGILFSYFLHKFIFKNQAPNKSIEDDDECEHNSRLFGFSILIGGLCLIFTVTFLTYPWLHNDSYNNFASALYGSVHRTVWSIGWTMIIYVCVVGLLPALNKFLSCSIFRFLSKLTYQNYVVHSILISAILFSTRQKVYFSDFNLIAETILYLAVTMTVSIGTYLMFEKPATNLQMTFLK